MTFPQLNELKRLRERIGMSQSELATKVGVSQSTIPKYESGKQVPSYNVAVKIFNILQDADLEISPEVWEIMTPRVRMVNVNTKLGEAKQIMNDESISQIPITKGNQIVGTVSESLMLNLLDHYHNLGTLKETPVGEIMEEILPMVPRNAKLKEIISLLKRYSGILVMHLGSVEGIVTKANLLEM